MDPISPSASTIAERLKLLRDKEELSQREFAKCLDISLSALQAYESGKSIPGSHVLEHICSIWPINGHWLLTGRGPVRLDGIAKTLLGTGKKNEPVPDYVITAMSIIEDLGLTELALLSANSRFGPADTLQQGIQKVLEKHPDGLTAQDLFDAQQSVVKSRGFWAFQEQLKVLVWAGLIKTEPRGHEPAVYTPANPKHFFLRANGVSEVGELVRDIVERIVKVAFPAVLKEKPTGTLRRFRVPVTNQDHAIKLIKLLQDTNREVVNEQTDENGNDAIVVIFSAYLEPKTDTRTDPAG